MVAMLWSMADWRQLTLSTSALLSFFSDDTGGQGETIFSKTPSGGSKMKNPQLHVHMELYCTEEIYIDPHLSHSPSPASIGILSLSCFSLTIPWNLEREEGGREEGREREGEGGRGREGGR